MNDGVEEVCWRFGCWTEKKMRGEKYWSELPVDGWK
jgi:hypothetical protein